MADSNRIRNLELRKNQLVESINYTVSVRNRLEANHKRLQKMYESGKISYRKFKEVESKSLQGRQIEDWVTYYDDCVRYYEREYAKCEREIIRSQNLTLPLLVMLVVATIGLGALVGALVSLPGSGIQDQFVGLTIEPNVVPELIAFAQLSDIDYTEINETNTTGPPVGIGPPNGTDNSTLANPVFENFTGKPEPKPGVVGFKVETLPGIELPVEDLNHTENITEEIVTIPIVPIEENITTKAPEQESIITNITEGAESNISIITSRVDNLIQHEAEIGKPVAWTKQVLLPSFTSRVEVPIPPKTSNVTVKRAVETSRIIDGATVREKEYIDITSNVMIEERAEIQPFIEDIVDWFVGLLSPRSVKKEVDKVIIVPGLNKELIIDYYTEPPSIYEEHTALGKRVIISSDTHYNNVKTYAAIPNLPPESIKLYWLVNGTRKPVEFVTNDTNSDSLVDYIEWITPHTSNETFEIELTILNVQSYPIVGESWTVSFNTTGAANLSIRAFNGTTWSPFSEAEDLKLLEVRCGEFVQDYDWIWANSSVFIENYSCSSLSAEESKVITAGKHTLEFTFGPITKYAFNDATNRPTIDSFNLNATTHWNSTRDNLTAYTTASDLDGDSVKLIYNWYKNGTSRALLNMPFEGGSNDTWTRDYSPYGYNGTVVGAVWNATGGYDQLGAYSFDGTDDYINTTLQIDQSNSSSLPITFEVRVMPDTTSGIGHIISTSAGGQQWGILQNHDKFAVSNGNRSRNFTTVVPGIWYHFSVRLPADGSDIIWTVNTATFIDLLGVEGFNATFNNVTIGGSPAGGLGFDGVIDEVRIYNEEIQSQNNVLIYRNITNTTSSWATLPSQNWSLDVTPNDGFIDGDTVTSLTLNVNSVPALTGLTFNTTGGTNFTTENLTAYVETPIDADNDSLTYTYNYIKDGQPYAVLIMPFERVNASVDRHLFDNPYLGNARDYSGYGNHGNDSASDITWEEGTGFNNSGAYRFDGIDDFIRIENATFGEINTTNFTVMAHIRKLDDGIGGIFSRESSIGGNSGAYLMLDSSSCDAGTVASELFQLTVCSTSTITVNETYHVAVRYNGTGLAIFVKGIEEASSPTSLNDSSNGAFMIGNGTSSNSFFDGFIDNLFVYNISLSNDQIYAFAQNRTNEIVAAETAKGEVWNVSVVANDGLQDSNAKVASMTVLGPNSAPTITDIVLNATTIANHTADNLTTYVETSDVDNDNVSVIYNWEKDGIPYTVFNMPFEKINGTDVNNTHDYGPDQVGVTEFNGVTWNATSGYDGNGAYEFDGLGGNLDVDSGLQMNFTVNFSWTLWMKPFESSTETFPQVFSRSIGGATGEGYSLSITESTDRLQHTIRRGTDGGAISAGQSGITFGEWIHAAGTYNGTTVTLYINGELVDSGSGIYDTIFNRPETLNFGADRLGSVGYYNGTLDEIVFYNTTLTDDQIYAIYLNRSNEIVSSETLGGEVWTVRAFPNDGSLDGDPVARNITVLSTAKPTVDLLVLNATTSNNFTVDNLTAYVINTDADGDDVKNIFNWIVGDDKVTVVNMPFEKINLTSTDNAHDYSGNNHHGTVTNAGWNATIGYDGKGAYLFDGDDYIQINDTADELNFTRDFSISAWVRYFPTADNNFPVIVSKHVGAAGYNFHVQDTTDTIRWVVTRTSGNLIATASINQDELTFVTVTYNGTAARLFVNGESAGIATGSDEDVEGYFRQPVIGSWSVANNFFWNGTIDEVMFYNRTLTDDQVYTLYQNGTNKIVSAETQELENWTVIVFPNDGNEDGAGVTSDGLFIRSTQVAPSITSILLNATSISNLTTDNLTIHLNVTDDNGDDTKVMYNWRVNDELVTILNMPFEKVNNSNTDNAYDYSTNAFHGTVHNDTNWNATAGYDGKGAFVYNSSPQYITIQDDTVLNLTINFTITAWVKIQDFSTIGGVTIVSRGRTAPSKGFRLFVVNSTKTLFFNTVGLTESRNVESTADLEFDRWYHVAATYNGSRTALYINGVFNESISGTNEPLKALNTTVFIGVNPPGVAQHFNGTIDDIGFYNRALSDDQIYALYQNRTDEIVATETIALENWSAVVIPNDGIEDGTPVVTNNVTIQPTTAGIFMEDSVIEFGSGYFNQTCSNDYSVLNSNTTRDCWTNTTAFPTVPDYHILSNNGTANLNITVSVQSLNDAEEYYCETQQGCTGTESARIAIKSQNSEASSCSTGLTSEYEVLANHTSVFNVGVCDSLGFSDSADELNMTVELRQPQDTFAGLHEMVLVYEATVI